MIHDLVDYSVEAISALIDTLAETPRPETALATAAVALAYLQLSTTPDPLAVAALQGDVADAFGTMPLPQADLAAFHVSNAIDDPIQVPLPDGLEIPTLLLLACRAQALLVKAAGGDTTAAADAARAALPVLGWRIRPAGTTRAYRLAAQAIHGAVIRQRIAVRLHELPARKLVNDCVHFVRDADGEARPVDALGCLAALVGRTMFDNSPIRRDHEAAGEDWRTRPVDDPRIEMVVQKLWQDARDGAGLDDIDCPPTLVVPPAHRPTLAALVAGASSTEQMLYYIQRVGADLPPVIATALATMLHATAQHVGTLVALAILRDALRAGATDLTLWDDRRRVSPALGNAA